MQTRTIVSLICAGALVVPTLRGQDKPVSQNDIPAPVLAAFHQSYPAARIRGTSTETEKGKTYYEIESINGKQSRDILYIADGTAVEIEEAMPAKSLPAAVRHAVMKEFHHAEVTKAERVTKGAALSYEIHVRRGAQHGSVVIDTTGTVLEKHALATPKKTPPRGKKDEDEEEDD